MMSAPRTGRLASDAAADYAPHVREARWRQVREVEGLVLRAERGYPDALRDYLLQGPQLYTDDCRALARLIDRKVPRVGRPKESFSTGNAALRCAVYLVRAGNKAWCRKHGYRRASKNAPTDRLIARAVEVVDRVFPTGTLTPEHVRKFVNGERKFKTKPTRGQVERCLDAAVLKRWRADPTFVILDGELFLVEAIGMMTQTAHRQ